VWIWDCYSGPDIFTFKTRLNDLCFHPHKVLMRYLVNTVSLVRAIHCFLSFWTNGLILSWLTFLIQWFSLHFTSAHRSISLDFLITFWIVSFEDEEKVMHEIQVFDSLVYDG
jgi:hypothetical protein